MCKTNTVQFTALEGKYKAKIYIQYVYKENGMFECKSSGGSSVSQNKLPQLILGYIYILKYFKATLLVRFYSFEIHNQ